MDKGDFEQIKQYLKTNLNIDIKIANQGYGTRDHLVVSLILEKEIIAQSVIHPFEINKE